MIREGYSNSQMKNNCALADAMRADNKRAVGQRQSARENPGLRRASFVLWLMTLLFSKRDGEIRKGDGDRDQAREGNFTPWVVKFGRRCKRNKWIGRIARFLFSGAVLTSIEFVPPDR